MEILYGVEDNYKNVTDLAMKNCIKNGYLYIPKSDLDRSMIFGDPVHGKVKNIKFIYNEYFAICPSDNFLKFKLINVFYGVDDNLVEVTDLALNHFIQDDYLNIPKYDIERSKIFGDPIPNVVKKVRVLFMGVFYDVEDGKYLSLDISDLKFGQLKINNNILDPEKRLDNLHSRLNIQFENKYHEYPEQLMAVNYIEPNDVVLELGANVGRNTCVIASILNDSRNLVTFETSEVYAERLNYNKLINGFEFNIENGALSYKPLIQSGWNTKVQETETVPNGFFKVNTMTFEELLYKYNLNFNVLVLDCEGAIYQILKDNPNILVNINKVIIENDFNEIENKEFVDDVFNAYGLYPVYTSTESVWGPCKDFFYQVFMRR